MESITLDTAVKDGSGSPRICMSVEASTKDAKKRKLRAYLRLLFLTTS